MNKSIAGRNTFWATLFSDGTSVAPMPPEYPRDATCKGCRTFYDFNKEIFIKDVEHFAPTECNARINKI